MLLTAELVNTLLVGFEFLMKLLNDQVEGAWWQWLLSVVGLVDKSLKSNWISTSLSDFLWVDQSEVFKTVDLAESPEHVIFILTRSLNLEFLLESLINLSTISESVKHLSLGKWTRGVNVKIVLNLFLGVGVTNTVFENTESADQVVIGQVAIWSNTLGSRALIIEFVAKFWEESKMQLRGNVEPSGKSRAINWCFHPGLSEQRICESSFFLECLAFEGSESSNRSIEDSLSALNKLIFINLLGIDSIVAILCLNTLDLEFTIFDVLFRDVP